MLGVFRIIRDLVVLREFCLVILLSLFLSVAKSPAQEEIFGSGEFILNEGPVYSDTGTWIGSYSSSASYAVSTLISKEWNWQLLLRISDNLPHSIQASSTHGAVTKSPDQEVYDFNTTVILTAVPEPGYAFQKWTVNGVDTSSIGMSESGNPTLILKAILDFEVVAHFAPISRIIELRSVDLELEGQAVGGSSEGSFEIRNNGNSPITVESISVPSGFRCDWAGTIFPGTSKTVTVTFTPTKAGAYSGDITIISDATEGTTSIPVSGVAQNAYLLTGASTFGGMLTPATSRWYWQDSVVTLKAMPVAGYVFMNWTEAGKILSTKAEFELPISRGYSVRANYLPESRSLKIRVKHGVPLGKPTDTYRGKIIVENTGTLPVYLSDLRIQGKGFERILVSGLWFGWIEPGSVHEVEISFNPTLKKSYRLKITAVAKDLSSPVKPFTFKGVGNPYVF